MKHNVIEAICFVGIGFGLALIASEIHGRYILYKFEKDRRRRLEELHKEIENILSESIRSLD